MGDKNKPITSGTNESSRTLLQSQQFEIKSRLSSKYGRNAWRDTQSPIDIMQNHLDACANAFHLRLFDAIGLKRNVTPSAAATIALLRIYQGESDVQFSAELKGVLSDSADKRAEQINQLRQVEHNFPKLKFIVRSNGDSKSVSSEEIAKLSKKWELVGVRIIDTGFGFDKQYLGLIGATSKDGNPLNRGGLGEGLKMSVLNLARQGIRIRLWSVHAQGTWYADPDITTGELVFSGEKIDFNRNKKQSGSVTYIDFGGPEVSAATQKLYRKILDPRNGDGLKSFILDLKYPNQPVLPYTLNVLTNKEERSKLFLLGLYVEQLPNLLFGYNLTDKKSIGGRDRKNVDLHTVISTVRCLMAQTQDIQIIRELLSAVKKGKETFEMASSFHLVLPEENHSLWKMQLETVFSFTPGKDVFVFVGDKRGTLAAQNSELRPIFITADTVKFFEMVRILYPGQSVTAEQLMAINLSNDEKRMLENDPTKFNPAQEFLLQRAKNFVMLIASAIGLPIEELRSLEFKPDTSATTQKNRFKRAGSTLYIPKTEDLSIKTLIAYEREIFQIFSEEHEIHVKTQEIITYAMSGFRQSVLPVQRLGDLSEYCEVRPLVSSIRADEKYEINSESACQQLLAELYAPNLQRHDVEQIIVSYAELQSEYATTTVLPANLYLWDGELYRINPEKASLDLVTGSQKEVNQQLKDLLPFEPSFNDSFANALSWAWSLITTNPFKSDQHGFNILDLQSGVSKLTSQKACCMPLMLKEGESFSVQCTSPGGVKTKPWIVTRNNGVLTYRTNVDGEKDDLQAASGKIIDYVDGNKRSMRATIFEDLIVFSASEPGWTIESASVSMASKNEQNRGEPFLETSIETTYGASVWTQKERMFTDLMQNHIDAVREVKPEIIFTILNTETCEMKTVLFDEIKDYPREWMIAGCTVQDAGPGYPTPYLVTLGDSTKSGLHAGKFGEGLKLLITTFVRENLEIQLGSRDWKASPTSIEKTVTDFEGMSTRSYQILGYNMTWEETERKGSYTYFGVLPYALSSGQDVNKDTVTQSLVNLDTKKIATWSEWCQKLDPRSGQNLAALIIDSPPQFTDGIVSVYIDRPNQIFEKDLFICSGGYISSEEYALGYNFHTSVVSTRERNKTDNDIVFKLLSDLFKNQTSSDLLVQILRKHKEDPQKQLTELGFFEQVPIALVVSAYYEVFGSDAILSLRSLGDEKFQSAVANEVHINRESLVTFRHNLTFLLKDKVATSATHMEERLKAPLNIDPILRDALFASVVEINQELFQIMQFIIEDDDLKVGVSDLKFLQEQIRKLAEVRAEDLGIIDIDGLAGKIDRDSEGKAKILYHIKTVSNIIEFRATHFHEAAHFLSGEADYTNNFNEFMLLVAEARIRMEIKGLFDRQ